MEPHLFRWGNVCQILWGLTSGDTSCCERSLALAGIVGRPYGLVNTNMALTRVRALTRGGGGTPALALAPRRHHPTSKWLLDAPHARHTLLSRVNGNHWSSSRRRKPALGERHLWCHALNISMVSPGRRGISRRWRAATVHPRASLMSSPSHLGVFQRFAGSCGSLSALI